MKQINGSDKITTIMMNILVSKFWNITLITCNLSRSLIDVTLIGQLLKWYISKLSDQIVECVKVQ